MFKHPFAKTLLVIMALALLAACAPETPATETVIATEPAVTNEPSMPIQTFEPIDIKVGYVPYSSYLPFYIAQEEGYFLEQNLNVELIKFAQQVDAIPVLVAGDIDVYAGQLDTMSLNAIAQGSGIKYVADKGYDNPEGCVYTAWVARQDIFESGVLDDLHNLAGMNIAFPVGQSPQYALDLLLSEVGLSSADVNIVDVSAPNRVVGLGNGAIDITFLSEPFITQVLTAGTGSIWKAWETYMPDFQLAVTMYGESMFENPQAGERFMVAYLKAVRQYMEGTTDRNMALMAEFLNTTPEIVRASCWQSIRLDGSINAQSILDFEDWLVEEGFLLQKLETEAFWDPFFIDYANEILGTP